MKSDEIKCACVEMVFSRKGTFLTCENGDLFEIIRTDQDDEINTYEFFHNHIFPTGRDRRLGTESASSLNN
jgi:hypothetical protein